jgi:hypothetical protein
MIDAWYESATDEDFCKRCDELTSPQLLQVMRTLTSALKFRNELSQRSTSPLKPHPKYFVLLDRLEYALEVLAEREVGGA